MASAWAGAMLGLAALLAGCGSSTTDRLGLPPLQTVPRVDLARYAGTWYEIASFPQRFQQGCTLTTATYTLRADGGLDVENRCRKGSPDGEAAVATGRARVVEPESGAKLQVSFFWPFWGDYWIVDLSPDYAYAVVGHPSRDYLWILSREPTLPEAVLQGILERLAAQGYELARLQRTLQAPPGGAERRP